MASTILNWLKYLLSSGDITVESAALRTRANDLYSQAKTLSAASQAAFQAGDKAKAKQLSDQRKKLFAEAEATNEKAMRQILKERNGDPGRPLNELDLHGLFVKEAVKAVEERVALCRKQGEMKLVVITGRGLHSENNVAKLRPRIIQFAEKNHIPCEIGVPNDGCLTLDLSIQDSIIVRVLKGVIGLFGF